MKTLKNNHIIGFNIGYSKGIKCGLISYYAVDYRRTEILQSTNYFFRGLTYTFTHFNKKKKTSQIFKEDFLNK